MELPKPGTWLRCLGCDCIEEGVVLQVTTGHGGVMVRCSEEIHMLAPENMDDFVVVEPVYLTQVEKADVVSAIRVAYADGDAPIFDTDGIARLEAIESAFGVDHVEPTQPIG